MRTINITNGECFNEYFEKKYKTSGIPFNEAMMSGDAPEPIFDNAFIAARAAVHTITPSEYNKKMIAFSDFIKNTDNCDEAVLWFGNDAFCQINMITVLALLESVGFEKKVYSVIINDSSFEIKREKTQIPLGTWRDVYRYVLQLKKSILFGDDILDNAVRLYLDFVNENGMLARYVKKNAVKSEYELTVELLKMSEAYGLSDTQALSLIRKYKNVR